MNKTLIAAALLSLSSTVFAVGVNPTHPLAGSSPSSSASNSNANAVSSAQAGAVATQGQGQKQGQGQGQIQKQSQSTQQANTQDASSSNTVSNTNVTNYQRPPVATAYAAPLVAGVEACMGSSSAAAQTAVIGISFGSTWENEACNRRMDSAQLNRLGYTDAAIALMCQSQDIQQAMLDAGTPCKTRKETIK